MQQTGYAVLQHDFYLHYWTKGKINGNKQETNQLTNKHFCYQWCYKVPWPKGRFCESYTSVFSIIARNLLACYTAVSCVVTQRSSPQTTAENLTCFSINRQRKEQLWRSRQKSFEQRPKTIYREIRETWNQPVRIRCMLTIFPSTSRYTLVSYLNCYILCTFLRWASESCFQVLYP